MPSSAIHILVVDDEPDLCALTKAFLEKPGEMEVDTVCSVPEARDALGKKRFDAIISDYQMPGENGIQFLKSIRAEGNKIPFILFTGKGREEVVIEALNNGADSYLQKGGQPIPQYAELGHRVRSLVGRRRTDVALQDSESEFRTLFENNPDAVILIGLDGTILNCNEATTHILLMNRDEIVGRTAKELGVFSPEDYALFQKNLSAEVKGESRPATVSRILRKDGSVKWVEGRASIVTKTGKASIFQIIARDITERKLGEEALIASQNRYRILVDSANEAILVAQDGMLKFANQATSELTEFSHEELISSPFWAFVNPADRAMVLENYQKRTEGESAPANYVFRLQTKLGATKWVKLSAVAIDWDGRPASLSFLTDISDRKMAEEALRESEGRYRSLYTDSRDAIMILSPERGYLAGNPATCRLFACRNDKDFISHTTASLSPKYQPDGALSTVKIEEMRHLALENGTQYFEWTYQRADGSCFPATVLLSRLENGEEPLLQATVRDITDSKRGEQALSIANGKLNLLSNITRHDISNQMSILDGYLSLLETRQPHIASDEYLIKARMGAKRISDIIRFTQEYQDIGIQAPVWHDVRKLVESSSGEIQSDEVSLLNDIPPGTEVYADPLIVKVFQNLIQNARRHGHVVTAIRFSIEEKEGVQTIVCEDDGEGIPLDVKGRLFTKGFGKDHGLGLFLSREILSITGITITEDGEFGKGARFVITPLPNGFRLPG